jgi:hypothetical protein
MVVATWFCSNNRPVSTHMQGQGKMTIGDLLFKIIGNFKMVTAILKAILSGALGN